MLEILNLDLWQVVAIVAGAVAALSGLLIGAKKLYLFLRLKNGYANEEEIEAVLLPFLYQAMWNVFELETHALDWFGNLLESADKIAIANHFYDLFKDVEVPIISKWLKIRLGDLVSASQWAAFVQNAYQFMHKEFVNAKDGLLKIVSPPEVTFTRTRKTTL